MATWFVVTFTGDPTDADRERVAELVTQGFTSGQLLNEPDDAPLYAVTREMAEELAGRELTDEEVSRIASSIEHSTVREAVEDAVSQVIDLPGEDSES